MRRRGDLARRRAVGPGSAARQGLRIFFKKNYPGPCRHIVAMIGRNSKVRSPTLLNLSKHMPMHMFMHMSTHMPMHMSIPTSMHVSIDMPIHGYTHGIHASARISAHTSTPMWFCSSFCISSRVFFFGDANFGRKRKKNRPSNFKKNFNSRRSRRRSIWILRHKVGS